MEMTNPYQTPAGELTSQSDEVGVVRFFSPSCRIGRLRYLSHIVLLSLVSYVAMLPLIFMSAAAAEFAFVFWALLVVAYIAMTAAMFVIMIQRLHDLNQSGWFSLLAFVPLVNLFLGLYLTFWPGTEGRNNYGANPPPNTWWNWVLGLSIPVVALIGVIAALALPNMMGSSL